MVLMRDKNHTVYRKMIMPISILITLCSVLKGSNIITVTSVRMVGVKISWKCLINSPKRRKIKIMIIAAGINLSDLK